MSQNSKELKVKYHKGEKPSKKFNNRNPRPGNSGQWTNPGVPTEISSRNITMKDVPYPVRGVDNLGNEMIMMPGAEYTFPGSVVTEYPMMKAKAGGWLEKYQTGREKLGLNNINTAVASTTSVKKPVIVPMGEEPLPVVFEIVDEREVHPVTGKKIDPKRDLKGGKYDTAVIQAIAEQSKRYGLNQDQALDLMGIAFQETLFGKTDDNIGHSLHGDPISGTINKTQVFSPLTEEEANSMSGRDMDIRRMIMNYVYNTTIANKPTSDRVRLLQYYNTPYPKKGSVRPSTEEEYHGGKSKAFYSVPVTEDKPLSMDTNPYGLTVLSLRNDLLANNPVVKEVFRRTYRKTGGRTGWLDQYQTGREKKYTQPINPVTGKPFPPQGIEVSASPLDLIGAGSVVGLLRGAGALTANLVNRAHPADRGWMNRWARWAETDLANTLRQTYEDARDMSNQGQKTKKTGGSKLPPHLPEAYKTGGWLDNYQDGGANTATASTQQQERPVGTTVGLTCGYGHVETTDENGNPVCVSLEEWERRLKPFNDASQAKLEEARKNDPNPSGNPKASWNPAIDGPYPKIRGYNEPLESNFSSYCIDCDENDSRSMRRYMRSQRRLQRKQEREMRRFERQNSPGFFEKFKDMDFEAPRLGIGRFFKNAWKGIKDACTPGEDCPSFEEGGQWLEKYQTPPGEFVYKGNNYILKNDESTNYIPKFYAVKYGPGPSLPSYIEAAPKFQQELQSFYNNQRFTPQPPKNISTGTQKNENLLDIQKTLNKANASVAARSSTNVTLRDPEAESEAAMAKAQEEAQERRGYIRQGVSEEEKFAQAQRRATGAALGLSPGASDVGYQQAMYIPQAIGTGALVTYGALPALNWFNNTLVGQGLGAYGAVQGVTSIPGHLQEFDEKPATTIGNLTLDVGLGVLGYKYGFKPLFNRGRNAYNALNTRWNRYLFGDDIINTPTINTPTTLPGSSNNIISSEGYVPGSSLRNSIFTKSNKNWLDKYE